MGSATWPTAAATRRQVETSANHRRHGRDLLHDFRELGAFIVMPTRIGAKTTCKVETTIPAGIDRHDSTKKGLAQQGRHEDGPMVVAVVMSTERATLPFAMKVQRLTPGRR